MCTIELTANGQSLISVKICHCTRDESSPAGCSVLYHQYLASLCCVLLCRYLEHVPLSQLDKLVSVIRDKLNGMSLEASLARNADIHHIDPEEDLNKVLPGIAL